MKRLITIILSVAMLIGMPATTFAQEANCSTQPVASENMLSEEIISIADPFISLNDSGLFEISNYDQLSDKLTPDEMDLVKLQLDYINGEISNTVKASDEDNVVIDEDSKVITIYSAENVLERAAKEGVNKLEWKWFGVRIYLSKSTVNHILNAGVAAGAAYITVQFPGVGMAIASAVGAYLLGEFGTSHISRAIYVDVGLKRPSLTNPGVVGIRGYGFQ